MSRLLALLLLASGCFSTPALLDGDGGAGACDIAAQPDLVAYLSFDQIEGGKVLDASPFHHDGTIHGALTTESGRRGDALRFSASDQYLDLGSPDTLDQLLELTVCVWVQPDTSGDHMTLVDKSLDGNHEGWNMYLAYSPANVGIAFMNRSSVYEESAFVIPRNSRWVHVCTSWDGTAGTLEGTSISGIDLWVDGARAAPAFNNIVRQGPLENERNFPLLVGANSGADKYTYHGAMDELVIFERVLDEAQITALRDCAP